jgi:AcrR family transcriptional regulator
MTRANPSVSSRKQPKQTRSAQLVADILDAAAQVLAKDGARRFTTARVAERAGVSVGSLYQYFPNKEAILFRLQAEEWAGTKALLEAILTDRTLAPPDRVRRAVAAFFRTECEEAAMRMALEDAAPLYRDAPESATHRAAGLAMMAAFLREAVPDLSEEKCRLAAHLVVLTLGAAGKGISEAGLSAERVEDYARETSDMLSAYLAQLSG